MLHERFHMKDLGRFSFFLRTEFDGFVKINQGKYPRKILIFKYAIVKQGPGPLGRSLNLAVKHLMIAEIS